jgi:membrane-associated protein
MGRDSRNRRIKKMANFAASTSVRVRAVAYVALLLILLGAVAPIFADPPVTPGSSAVEESSDNFLSRLFSNLFNSRALLELLADRRFTVAAFLALNIIVVVETGLVIGFFLPGDSLLVTAGVACYMADWNLPLLLGTLCVSAIAGDSVGYSIGFKTGPRIFNREKSWFFNKDHLLKAQAFYEKHGGKTIILARFMPIVRTFAPVVAGVARMDYRRFLFFNIFGGIGWVLSMVLIGFFLSTLINPALRPIFGDHFDVHNHIEKVVILVVLLSISPGIYVWLRSKFKSKPALEPNLAEVGK